MYVHIYVCMWGMYIMVYAFVRFFYSPKTKILFWKYMYGPVPGAVVTDLTFLSQ